jgi:DNA-directed RNA polymerase subunit RPC12/RpoP
MRFTHCPSCGKKAITSIGQVFKEEYIRCSSCNAKLIHSVRYLVSILVIHLLLYITVIQFLIDDGFVVVAFVTALFTASILASVSVVPLVLVEENTDTRILKWHQSPIPYLLALCAIAWLWSTF